MYYLSSATLKNTRLAFTSFAVSLSFCIVWYKLLSLILFSFYTNYFLTKKKALISNAYKSFAGDYQIWTGDQGVADPCLTAWLSRHMTPTGIEPVLPPWKGDVLTAWPRSQNSPSWARTNNPTINSRVLYHWAIRENLKVYLQNCTLLHPFFGQDLDRLVLVSYMRYRTSTSNLSTLSSSRGLTGLTPWDILSWGGLHA